MDWCNYSRNYSWVNVWLGVLMNATKLADLYDAPYEYPEWGSKAQAMLRQQQAEIEALKAHPANVTYELTMEKCRELLKENEALKVGLVDKTEKMQGCAVDKTQFLQGSVDLDDLEDRDSYEFSFHEVKAALALLRQQQELLDGADVIIKELQGRLREKIAEIERLKQGGEPVGWFINKDGIWWEVDENDREDEDIPLYTHPVKELPNNHQYIAQLEMTVRNQQAEIEALKDEVAMWKMSYENNIRMEDGYGLN